MTFWEIVSVVSLCLLGVIYVLWGVENFNADGSEINKIPKIIKILTPILVVVFIFSLTKL